VVDVVDASNLERNLYLAQQLKELDIPLVLAFNIMDEARKQGYKIDVPQLSLLLGHRLLKRLAQRARGSANCSIRWWISPRGNER